MKHKDKLRMARRLRTKAEVKAGIPPFQSEAWMKRKTAIKKRVERVEAKAKARAELRRKSKEKEQNAPDKNN